MTNDNQIKTIHNIIMENRKTLSLSGVTSVEAFDENIITLFTQCGMLIIRGYELHITKLSTEIGEVSVEGDLVSLEYSNQEHRHGGGFFRRLFK